MPCDRVPPHRRLPHPPRGGPAPNSLRPGHPLGFTAVTDDALTADQISAVKAAVADLMPGIRADLEALTREVEAVVGAALSPAIVGVWTRQQ